jgi:hypothetical protein
MNTVVAALKAVQIDTLPSATFFSQFDGSEF